MTEYRELTYETQAYNELIPIAEDIKKLVSANILLPMEGQLLPDENPYCVLHINDIFWRALMLRWNAYSGEIE